ncbi:MAG TPA: type 4a pilus biogenesis protein PilO [Candidatus Eremiobacteraceae bacterium]|nr:type 4a pilus biogenesis protein PilO [Candidatus Eremiobacteraceae bacterium]
MNFQLTPMNRNLIVAAVVLVIGFVGYFSMYQPKHNELVADQDKLAQLQQNYTDLKRVADQKPQYLALEQQISSRLTGVELTADTRAYIPSYLKQIEDLATRDGLTVTAVVPQPLPTPAGGATAAPAGPASGPASLTKIAPIGAAVNAAGGASMQAAQTTNTAAAVGEAGPQGQPQNGTPAPGVTPAAGAKPAASTTTSARQNAIAYVNKAFQQVPVNMELIGTYSQLQQFLRDLNKFPKLIGVSSVTLSPSSAALVGESPSLHITLPITAYQLTAGQPVAPQPVNTPAPGSGG